MKKLFFIFPFLLVIFAGATFFQNHSHADTMQNRFWQVESIDTMKYSRDASRDPEVLQHIPQMVQTIASLHANYISIDTPYDEEFYPVLKAWVDEARKNNLHVWFRGNFSSWEGWFGYPPFKDPNEHHKLTHDFILRHPDLFSDGDIFTPVPEAENGGMGDPRGSDSLAKQFNSFLIASYNNCVTSFIQINKHVYCGFFSTNGDIAKEVLTPQTVSQIGNVVVIDHYVDSPQTLQSDLAFLFQKFPGAKIVFGEFGAPIPDINGDMTEKQQADFIGSLFDVFYQNRQKIFGVNYWVLSGGSTALVRDDTTLKPAAQVVADYYSPKIVKGTLTDTAGQAVSGVVLFGLDGEALATTDAKGTYSFPLPIHTSIAFKITDARYQPTSRIVPTANDSETIENIALEPKKTDWVYNLRAFLVSFFTL